MAESSGRFDTSVVGLVSLAMEDGFRTSLTELAKVHGNRAGLWLDQIEMDVMGGLKNSALEGVDGGAEADAMRAAVEELHRFFGEFRDGLGE